MHPVNNSIYINYTKITNKNRDLKSHNQLLLPFNFSLYRQLFKWSHVQYKISTIISIIVVKLSHVQEIESFQR